MKRYLKSGITAALCVVVMLCFVQCAGKVSSNKSLTANRTESPSLHVWDVSTVISDSGITRYRITTPEWLVYDKVKDPNWFFPQGIHFDKFDENLNVFAVVDADSAIYYTDPDQWVFIRNVRAVNLSGEKFETDLLYVDQKVDRIHTDDKIKVTQSDKIIFGVGFESNMRLSKYMILNPTGIIPIDDDSTDNVVDSVGVTGGK